MLNISRLRVFSKEKLLDIHESSLRILEKTGVVFQSEEVLTIFRKHGARIDGQTVHISKKMVEECLSLCPTSYVWRARDSKATIKVGEGQENVAISPNMGPVYIQSLKEGRRKGKLQDYVNLIKMCQESKIVNTVGGVPVDACDVAEKEKHIELAYHLIRNTDKPMVGLIRNEEQQKEIFEMIEIAFEENVIKNGEHVICASVNPLSPLRYGTEQLETLLAYGKNHQPIFFLPCIMAGITGPMSLYGTVVLQNTEILAGMVLMQLLQPGNPVVYSPASTVGNMRTAGYITGTPEANLINIACIQMGQEVYNVPTRSMAGLTDAKDLDMQAGFETMQNVLMLLSSGVNIINECVGVLDSIMTTSYEKFVIDEEILSRVLRITRGIDTYDHLQDVNVIEEVSHSGNYLMHQSTLESFRKCWRPELSDWNSYSDWVDTGSENIVLRASRKVERILSEAKETTLDKSTEKKLLEYKNKRTAN